MPIVETLTVTVGVSVAKSVLKVWLGPSAFDDTATALADLVAGSVSDFWERRRLIRQFESIAEDVAARLGPFFEHEFSGSLSENEQSAAAIAVSASLDATQLSVAGVVGLDLDPVQLEAAVRAQTPTAAADALLNPAATQLYNFALREACNYVVEIVVSLPSFTQAATRELLRREGEISRLVQEVLDQLPAPAKIEDSPDAAAERFESQYRREIARKLDQLTLFGLDQGQRGHRYALSVAYITLSAAPREQVRLDTKGVEATQDATKVEAQRSVENRNDEQDEVEDIDLLRVDQVLADASRVLIRGQAGSGKTTLLQWLAVTSAKRSFDGALDDLNGLTPFFIQLRRYVGRDLPTPEEFIRLTAAPLVGIAPQGWVTSKLAEGSALVLVDGVDELPPAEREPARVWLTDLCSAYPEARYVVTSRPPAVSEDWLSELGFAEAELQPMSAADIDTFVGHWHDAARREVVDAGDAADLFALEAQLLTIIASTRSVRVLATSPLLCAMLCTLNRSRRAHLPHDRISLYRIALETLIVRRDVERDVVDPVAATLTQTQREILLQTLAYWLLLNGRTDLSRSDAERLLKGKLAAMPGTVPAVSDVLDYLVLRSGVLREPVSGRLDFLHRTFQEYLGAKQAVEENHIGLLLERATDDTWAEVIVLSAGLANRAQREELLSGLLDDVDVAAVERGRLRFLAAACLETAPQLKPELTARIRAELAEVVPPRTIGEARDLSSAGDLATPLLQGFAGDTATTVRACIRALALIGSSAAMDGIAKYGRDRRKTVVRELVRAWSQFDRESFATKVLSDAPLMHGEIELTEPSVLPYLEFLTRLRRVAYEGRWSDQLLGLSNPTLLRRLNLSRRTELSSLDGFEAFSQLTEMNLPSARQLEDVTALSGLPLTRLTISGATALKSAEALGRCTQLMILDLEQSALERVDFLDGLTALGALTLAGAPVTDISPVGSTAELRVLDLRGCKAVESIEALANLKGLQWLSLTRCEGITDVSPLAACSRLTSVYLDGCTALESIEALAGLTRLRWLGLQRTAVNALPKKPRWTSVYSLSLNGCTHLETLGDLSSMKRLASISCIGCVALQDISGLEGSPVTRLDLENCRALESVDVIARLPSLEWLDLSGCNPDLDLAPLAGHPSLARVGTTGMDAALARAGLSPEQFESIF